MSIRCEDYNLGDQNYVIVEQSTPKENFDSYNYVEYVSEYNVLSEIERADELKDKAEHPLWLRTVLETQLSAIFSRHRKNEQKITELGYGLNEAKVQRRVYNHINKFKNPDQD